MPDARMNPILISVPDPDSLILDPDPAFYAEYRWIQIRIQGFDEKKLKNIYS
jgi:hypothetical protein